MKILLSLPWLSHPTISKFYQPFTWKTFCVGNPTWNYVSIITTIIRNITVLVSHNVICFWYFMPMRHGANEKTPPIVSPAPPPIPGFHQVCFLFYKKYFINLIFFWSDYLRKIRGFLKVKQFFFFQLKADRFWFYSIVCMRFLGRFFTVLLSWN